MDSSGNRAVFILLAAMIVCAAFVALFGYPMLISIALVAAFATLIGIVTLSAGDGPEKPVRPAAKVERRAARATN